MNALHAKLTLVTCASRVRRGASKVVDRRRSWSHLVPCEDIPLQHTLDSGSDIRVRALVTEDLHGRILRHGANTGDALSRILSRPPLWVRVERSEQRDSSVIRAVAYVKPGALCRMLR